MDRPMLRRQLSVRPQARSKNQCEVQYCNQMRKIWSNRIPIINSENLGEGRKQRIEIQLRGGRSRQPGKADRACQKDDAGRELDPVNDVGHDVFFGVADREGECQRSRIEPREIRKIHRAHPGKHAVGAEIENLAEIQNGLDVPFRPLAVYRRVQRQRCAVHADNHQDGKNTPREQVRQGTGNDPHGGGSPLRPRIVISAASQIAARRARKDQLPVDDRIDLEPIGFLEIGLDCAQRLIPLDPHL